MKSFRTNIHLALSFFIMLTSSLNAAVVSWDGGEGTNNWSDAKNWSNDLLPTFVDDVTIGIGVTVDLNISASILSLTLSSNSTLTIETGSTLTIDGVGIQAVHLNEGVLNVDGMLNIPSYSGNGMVIENSSKIVNKGSIQIQNILGGFGIKNLGTWSNFSSLSLGNIDARSLINEGTFSNEDTISIALSNNMESDGIYNIGDFTNTSLAHISIKDLQGTNSEGIENRGTFDQLGSILLEDLEYVGLACRGMSQFNNFGIITVLRSTRFGIEVAAGTLTNKPSGSIDIAEIEEDPFQVAKGVASGFSGNFINQGMLYISDISGLSSDGISGGFVNEGMIKISNIFFRGIDVTLNPVKNSGSIEICNNSSLSTDAHGISSIDSLINESTGVIKISDQTFLHLDGIINQGILINKGQIICDSLDQPILNEDTLTLLHNTGSIKILRSRVGVTNSDRAVILNEGSFDVIEVFHDPTSALLNVDTAIFHNLASGQVRLDSVYGPISNGFVNIVNAKLINDGVLIAKHITSTGLANVLNSEVVLNTGSITTVSFCGLNNVNTGGGSFLVADGALLTVGFDGATGDPLRVDNNFTCEGILNVIFADDF